MVVSSLTPWIPARVRAYQPASVSRRAPIAAKSASSSSFEGDAMRVRSCSAWRAEHHEQGSVSAVVEDHVCASTLAPVEDPVREVPVLGEALPLEGENRNAAGGNRRGRVILSREDIAGGPAHLGPEDDECLDEHRGLNRHVEGPRDARPPRAAGPWRTPRAPTSAPASRARRCLSPCAPTRPGRGRPRSSLCSLCSSHAPLHSREAGS